MWRKHTFTRRLSLTLIPTWLFCFLTVSSCAQLISDPVVQLQESQPGSANFELGYQQAPEDSGSSDPRVEGEYLIDSVRDSSGQNNPGLPPAMFFQPTPKSHSETTFDWRLANREALLFTGIMHTFNVTTEAGTRDALNGHWFQGYIDSLSELRGWSDSDKFMAPYVAHTIEGSVFGFIQRQNDPRFRKVQWGDGRNYFISLLHSLAYTAIWHTQWKIGPISEASIGNVMLHASPGFITLTDTPTLGTIAMIGEDATDRYLITGLENRTANRALLVLSRSFLNPGRSFANIMSFQVPWHRETRMGLLRENFRIRRELIEDYKKSGTKPFEYVHPQTNNENRTYPKAAPIELAAFPLYETFLGGGSCIGGGGSGAARVSPHFQVIAEVSGCLIMHMPVSNQSGDFLFYGGGLRWTPRAMHRVSPYLQVILGGTKVTHETDDLALRKKLLTEWNDGNGTLPHYPKRSDWSVEVANNGPTFGIGGGFEVVFARPFSWRLLSLDYSHTWMDNVAMIQPQTALRIYTGAVLRIGTW